MILKSDQPETYPKFVSGYVPPPPKRPFRGEWVYDSRYIREFWRYDDALSIKNVLLIYADKIKLVLGGYKHFLGPKRVKKIKFLPKITNFRHFLDVTFFVSPSNKYVDFLAISFRKSVFGYQISIFINSHDCEDGFKYAHCQKKVLRKLSVTILKSFILSLQDIISINS